MENLINRVSFDSGTANRCFSLLSQKYAVVDGIEERVGEPVRCSVYPGDWDLIKQRAPELLPIFETLWTEDVIQEWKDSVPKETPPE